MSDNEKNKMRDLPEIEDWHDYEDDFRQIGCYPYIHTLLSKRLLPSPLLSPALLYNIPDLLPAV